MTQTIKPRVVIVDKNDKIIGHKHRGTLNKEDIYRVSALWITNSQKEILLFPSSTVPATTGPHFRGSLGFVWWRLARRISF